MSVRKNVLRSDIFNSQKFRKLTVQAKVVHYALYNNPNLDVSGLFSAPFDLVGDYAGLTKNEVILAISELESAGYITYDKTKEVVLINNYILDQNYQNQAKYSETFKNAIRTYRYLCPGLVTHWYEQNSKIVREEVYQFLDEIIYGKPKEGELKVSSLTQ